MGMAIVIDIMIVVVSITSSLNGSNSNLAEATGRALASSFSAQSANAPSFHHSGLHTMHGSFVPNILSSIASRNTTMTTGPSSGLQQPMNINGGRFSSSNLPVALSQISHGHSGIPDRGGLNVVGSPGFGGGINGVGGSIAGVSSSSTSIGNRNSVPGMGINPILGNLGPQFQVRQGTFLLGLVLEET
ncbi:hypothetical protein HPP92_015608 [Vanilla planifolia]|uniref:Uncharacterized protein n=1 Tax=Vanilla planifolia TaxID=51239 RepID=A0A835QI81_VANPL|nr:hypothetical protein HPP92_015608 [Vanilla planifolia]